MSRIPVTGAVSRKRRLILLPTVEVLRPETKLHVIVSVFVSDEERILEPADHPQRVRGARFRQALVSDLVPAHVSDGHFGREIVLVVGTVLDLVHVHVAFASCGSLSSRRHVWSDGGSGRGGIGRRWT